MILIKKIEKEDIISFEVLDIPGAGRKGQEILQISDLFKRVGVVGVDKMNEITLRIRYKPNSKVNDIIVMVEENSLTCEVLAWKLAEVATSKYMRYLGGTKDKKFERRYKLGQFKMIRNYLEAKL